MPPTLEPEIIKICSRLFGAPSKAQGCFAVFMMKSQGVEALCKPKVPVKERYAWLKALLPSVSALLAS